MIAIMRSRDNLYVRWHSKHRTYDHFLDVLDYVDTIAVHDHLSVCLCVYGLKGILSWLRVPVCVSDLAFNAFMCCFVAIAQLR